MVKTRNNMLPYPVILAATIGDAEAIQTVWRYYAGYISKMSMQPAYDAYGNRHRYVDETIRGELENHLALAIIEYFRVVPDE